MFKVCCPNAEAHKAKPPLILRSAGVSNLAERVRFELTVPLKVHWISSPAHSTTLPPFQILQPRDCLLRLSLNGSMSSEKKIIDESNLISKPLFVSLVQQRGLNSPSRLRAFRLRACTVATPLAPSPSHPRSGNSPAPRRASARPQDLNH